MKGAYQHATKAGYVKSSIRYIEDPNRPIFGRVFLAIFPFLVLYIISPLDLIPEVILGPLGLLDDGAILIGLFLIIRLAYSFYNEKRYTSHKNSKTEPTNPKKVDAHPKDIIDI